MKKFKQFIQGTTLSQEEWEEEVFGPELIDTLKQVDEESSDQEKQIQHFKNTGN
jgi:predicted transcriptional regulator